MVLKNYILNIIILVTTTICIAQNPIEKEGWTLTFNDEFNDTVLDKSKWQDHPYWGGRNAPNSITYYGENQFQFTDSSMLLVAEKKIQEGIPYSSGMVDSHNSFKQQYGYFEIRSKNPKGTGFWPAFWLVSTEKWPPEIDIYEFYTNVPNRIKTNQQWLDKKEKKHMQPKGYKMKVDASTDFHTYAMEWTPKKITWYLDNKKIKTSRQGMKFFNYKMHIIVSVGVSDVNEMNLKDAIFPNALEVDYVRVYTSSLE